jgi:hypothetical protein
MNIRVNLRLCITSAQSLDPPKSPFKRGTLINFWFPPCKKREASSGLPRATKSEASAGFPRATEAKHPWSSPLL